jgi:DNA mismatch repair protein MutL
MQTADGKQQTEAETAAAPPWETDESRNALDPVAADKKKQEVQDWIDRIARVETHPGTARSTAPSTALSGYSLSIHHLPERTIENMSERKSGGHKPPGESFDVPPGGLRPPLSDDMPPIIQMLNRYLIMETEDGIALIDQHALHERILYEQLKERMATGVLPSQRLLVPVPVDLSPNEFSCVSENAEFFGTLGLSVEPFGGNTVLISAFPAMLSKTPPEEILLSLVEPFLELGKKLEQSELLNKLLHSMACQAAVKAGEKLSAESMQHLIQLAAEEINAHHCPHGRPSTIILTRKEIDNMFER